MIDYQYYNNEIQILLTHIGIHHILYVIERIV